MLLIAVSAVLAFVIALVLTPLCRNAANHLGWVDQPDLGRKIHRQPVPRIGGIPLFAAIAVSVAILSRFPQHVPAMHWHELTRLIPAFAVAFLTGLTDDLRGLNAWQKLSGQCAAAILAFGAGVRIENLAGHSIAHAWWHVPLTIVWLVACTNAFNLIDGVDGLAAGIGLFATLTTLVAALLAGNFALATATALLAGALFGFLPYNFNPATVFLGDCGSLSLGFLLGCYGVIWSQKSATLLGMTAPLIALWIPILETLLSVVRRLLRGQPIFGADRRHIHHRLLDLGFSSRGVVLLMYAAAGIAAGSSLLVSVSGTWMGGLIVLLFCAAVWLGVRRLKYGEFEIARRVLFGGVIQRVINAQVSLSQLDASLSAAKSSDERWQLLSETTRKMGFNALRLELNGRTWREFQGPIPRLAMLADAGSVDWLRGGPLLHTRGGSHPPGNARALRRHCLAHPGRRLQGEHPVGACGSRSPCEGTAQPA